MPGAQWTSLLPDMNSPPDTPQPSGRWRILLLLSLAELLGMSLWFTASAVAPQLQALWGLDAQQAGWLTTVVQLGFVAGTAVAALLNLADVVPARPYFAVSALCAAIANALLVAAPGFESALVLRFLTGFFLAGVYPPAMKMIATWFRTARGLAIGTIVGALTLGKATPYLLRAFEGTRLEPVVLTASAGAATAALLVGWGYREGPFPFARRPFSWRLVGSVLRHRPTRLAIGGYLGHMWELYAMWVSVTPFFFDFFLARGTSELRAATLSGVAGFAVIAMGAVGCVAAGAWADRLGRERVTIWAMAVSGACALLMGWLLHAPPALVVIVALVWGFSVVADSAQFSAVVTEVAPAHAVGTALTLQTALGFLLTSVTLTAVPYLRDLVGWPLALGILAVGPMAGIATMRRLKSMRIAEGPSVGAGGQ